MLQLYTPVPCESELSYNEKLQKKVRQVAAASTEERAKGIPTLPEKLYYDMLPQYPGYENDVRKLPVGINVETLEIQYLNVEKEPGLIIGEGGMGRTNTLCNALKHLHRNNVENIYVFDSQKGDLAFCRTQENVHYTAFSGAYEAVFAELEAELAERKSSYEKAKETDPYLTNAAFSKELPPVFVLVDVVQNLYEGLDAKKMIGKLEVLEEMLSYGFHLVASSEPEKGFFGRRNFLK